MLDLTKKYKTKCGYPVRKLKQVNALAPYHREVFIKGKWERGEWTEGGTPNLFTSNRELFENLTLIEVSDAEYNKILVGITEKYKKKIKQLSLF